MKDKTRDKRILLWNYRSVVGMLNYLAGLRHPDISIAVHQVAWFCTEPKRSYKKAIIRIARYLKCTAKFGIFYKVNLSKGIEVYVDADFTRAWIYETALDSNSVLSRTSYAILLFGYPLFWHSKL